MARSEGCGMPALNSCKVPQGFLAFFWCKRKLQSCYILRRFSVFLLLAYMIISVAYDRSPDCSQGIEGNIFVDIVLHSSLLKISVGCHVLY